MLVPNVDIKEFEKFGFRLCKGIPKRLECYYLCVSRGRKFIFVSPECFGVDDWKDYDSRIHSRPNCKYKDTREVIDIIYDLIKADMLKGDWEE